MKILRTSALVAASAVALGADRDCARARRRSGRHVVDGRQKGQGENRQLRRRHLRHAGWLAEPNDPETNQPKTDNNNKDASKQGRPLIGVPIVLGMKPAGGDKWEGQVYNAEDGNTYSGSFTMSGANTAELKGCVMGGLICKGQTWTRSN